MLWTNIFTSVIYLNLNFSSYTHESCLFVRLLQYKMNTNEMIGYIEYFKTTFQVQHFSVLRH